MKTRALPLLLAFALCSSSVLAAPAAGEPVHVVLVVIDTLRADHVSAYGYERETTPNLDRLASGGVLYEDAISSAPWTLPAHASLFTGLYVRDHGTTNRNWTLDPSHETLAQRLRRAGYHTAGYSNNVWLNDVSGLKRGFQVFEEMWRQQHTRSEGISVDRPATDMGGVRTTERIFGWIDGLPDDDRPFFTFVNYFEPHLPYRPTRPYDDDFLPEGASKPVVERLRSFYSPREFGYILQLPWMRVPDAELEILEALYDGEIAYIDSIIGRLVKGLEERGLMEKTVLVITSDHGEHFGENHMLEHKFSVFEPLIKVPLILYAPGRLPAGLRIAEPVQVHDVFGTLLELAGLDVGDARRLPLEGGKGSEYTFSQLDYPEAFLKALSAKIPGQDGGSFARALDTVRDRKHKLIRGSDGRYELYDLTVDPYESKDLAAERPEVVKKLRAVLEAFDRGEVP